MSPTPLSVEVRRRTNGIIKNSLFQFIWLTLILGIFFTGVFVLAIKIFSFAKGIFQFFLAICALSFIRFIVSPVIVGVYEWLIRFTVGEAPPLQDAFSRFSDLGNLLDSQKLIFLTIPLYFTAFFPIIVVFFFIIIGKCGDIYHTLLYVIIAFFISAKLLSCIFPLPHILIRAPHISFFKALALSVRSMKNNFGSFLRLMGEYALMLVVSLILFGLPLIYTLPYIFCSAVVYCDAVFEENKIYKHNLYY